MLAMHIPDGFIDAPVSLLAGVVAVAGIALCLRITASALDERQVPVVGLVAAFVFAVQMLNFPVANGTSGHLLGAVLAAVLVGPAAGALAVTVVLAVQALLFADGGLSALGLNVVNMALIGAFGGYAIFAVFRRLLGRSTRSVTVAAGLAASTAPVLAAIAFTIEYALGGNDAVSVGSVAGAMIGVHVLIGIGEGIITALAVGSVMAMRPDLVYGLRNLDVAPGRAVWRRVWADVATPRLSLVAFVAVGLAVAAALVVLIAPRASSSPDGLEKVAADKGIDADAREHTFSGGPFADYGTSGVPHESAGTIVAGLVGVAATFVVCGGLVFLVRRRGGSSPAPAGPSS